MESIDPKLIKVVSNPRKDFGNMEELRNSITACGILHPLVINSKKELVAGERRLKCALELGLKVVPTIELSSKDKNFHEEVKLIENIQRKDLTPMEESRAFNGYLKKTGLAAGKLATKLGKTIEYIERRINLLKLDQSCWDAVNKRKLEIGHAQLLCQMNKDQQKEAMKEIIDWDLTVQNFSDQIRWMKKVDFGELKFRPGDEYGFGSKQKTLLSSLGQELFPKSDVDHDLIDSPAFRKEMAAYVESERKKLRDKKIMVFSSEEEIRKEYPNAVRIGSWEDRYPRVVKSLPGSKGAAIVVDFTAGGLDKDIYALDPQKEKTKEKDDIKSTPEDNEEARKTLNLDRREKLKSKVSEFKRAFLIGKCKEMLKPGPLSDKVVIYYLMNHFEPDHSKGMEDKMKKLFAKGQVLDEVKRLAENIFYNMDEEVLRMAAEKIGVKLNKHFEITEEFLMLYTKEQMIKLAKELKIDLGKARKNPEIIEVIKKGWKKGQVPKIMEKA